MPSADCRMLMERNTHPNGRRRWVSPYQCACFQAREATAFPPFALGRFSRRRDVSRSTALNRKERKQQPAKDAKKHRPRLRGPGIPRGREGRKLVIDYKT